MEILEPPLEAEKWDYTLHDKKNCARCSKSARPACPVCSHTLSAFVTTMRDNLHGATICEVCDATIKVELAGIV